ncbi:MAG: alpha/beta fold hydrolase [Myxococcota bacterium]
MGDLLTRSDLAGPGIAILNLGGFANPDVLRLRRDGVDVVVKDWGRRSAWVRALVAPLLANHEAAMLARADGIPGVPRLRARIDRLALAMEYVEGRPLTRHSHGRALPPRFFADLETILERLAERGVAYLDLRSPTNVLITPSGAPALVDLGSALRLPIPRRWLERFERRALAKLRSRFEESPGSTPVVEDPEEDTSANLKAGGTRFRLREHGLLDDPVPVLFLPGAGLSARVFAPILARAEAHGRRAIGVDPPGFGGSRREVRSLSPEHVAAQIAALLEALRIARVDLAASGWGVLVGRALAARPAACVRRMVAIDGEDTSAGALERAKRRELASRDPEALRAQLRAALPRALPGSLQTALAAELARVPARNLVLAYGGDSAAPTLFGVGSPERVDLDATQASDPDRVWSALSSASPRRVP